VYSAFVRPAARTILIVDDNVDLTSVIAMMLKDEGFHVLVSNDALSALDEAARALPEIALLDLGLPGDIDGKVLGTRLRELCGGSIRLVAFTGYGSKYASNSVPAGFDAMLIKPATIEQLLAAIAGADG
jgi:DNA-binding response OmpR family regulator